MTTEPPEQDTQLRAMGRASAEFLLELLEGFARDQGEQEYVFADPRNKLTVHWNGMHSYMVKLDDLPFEHYERREVLGMLIMSPRQVEEAQ